MRHRGGSPATPSLPADNGRRLGIVGTLAAICLLVLVAHLPVRHSEYIQDDHLAIEENRIAAGGDLEEILSTPYWAGARGADLTLYRPATVLSFALEIALAGRPDPFVSHMFNLLLHLIATLLLYALALRLGAGLFPAAVAGLLFAVHPLHVEAVAGIVGRAEILAAIGSFGALLALSGAGPWARRDGSGAGVGAGRERLASWAAGALLLLALGGKEIALAALPLMVVMELLYRPGPWLRTPRGLVDRMTALLPSVLAVLVYLGLRVRALESLFPLQQPHPADNFLVLLDGGERIGTALGLLARTVQLLLFPVGLSIDYSGHVIAPEGGLLDWRPLLGLLLLAGALVLIVSASLAVHAGGRPPTPARRFAAFGAAMFLLPYLIIGNLLVPVGTIFAERLLYLPSAGFCLLCGMVLDRLAWGYPAFPHWSPERRARLIGTAFVVLLSAFSMLTWLRCTEWKDDESVFAAAARVQPASPRAHYVLGLLALERGRHEEALQLFDRTLELWPDHVPARLHKALAYADRGDYALAERWFLETLRREPAQSEALVNLGIVLNRLGRARESETALLKGVALQPGSALGWAELGNVRFNTGRYAGAVVAYRKAIALGRSDLLSRIQEAERRGGPAPAVSVDGPSR